MEQQLFFANSPEFLDLPSLRMQTRNRLLACPLIQRCLLGDRAAIEALHVGFWPFVREFEVAIDKHHLPREPLAQRFGEAESSKVRRTLVSMAAALAEMSEEEGSHAAHWKKDAANLGLDLDAIADAQKPIGRVAELISASYVPHLPTFFGVLAGTELIAEEMSALLIEQEAFTAEFSRGRWVWGEVHTAPHDGASHLEIDIDLGRAYGASDDLARQLLLATIEQTVDCFDQAACDVEAALAPATALHH